MGRFLIRVVIGAVALWVATLVLPGMRITTAGADQLANGNQTGAAILAYLFIGLIFGVINALVKPIVKLVSLPITCLTLGLFTLVINALMLWLTAWVSSYTPVPLKFDSFFFTAVLAAIIVSVISMIGTGITGINRQKEPRDAR